MCHQFFQVQPGLAQADLAFCYALTDMRCPGLNRNEYITINLLLSCLQLRQEMSVCSNQAAFICIFAAVTSRAGAEDVTYVIEASDDCLLTSAGCTFGSDGVPVLSRHLQAGILQAIAREDELGK